MRLSVVAVAIMVVAAIFLGNTSDIDGAGGLKLAPVHTAKLSLLPAAQLTASQDPLYGKGFVFADRYRIYETLNTRATDLWRSSKLIVVKETHAELFPQFPVFQLLDCDGDGIPEEFGYFGEGRGNTQEFGFFFDLNGDGKADYILFYVGPTVLKPLRFVWIFTHAIDSNGDGKIDILVRGGIDLDGDGFADPGATTWFYDRNFDGKIDDGEYLAPGIQLPIERKGDVLISKRAHSFDSNIGGGPRIGEGFEPFDTMLRDLNTALR